MSVSIVILGDICPEDGFPELFASGSADSVFTDIISVLAEADYVVANLEAPVTLSNKKLYKNSVCLKSNPSDVHVLREAGINAVALANNHIVDYDTDGVIDTFTYLSAQNIEFYGAGDVNKAAKPHFANVKGKKIGFLAFAEHEFNCAADYGIGANLWDDLDGIVSIRRAKEQCDFLIVQYHGGIEHYIYPSPQLQKICRAMAEAGADFISCQHSHCIGTREEWQGTEILYGQGNCIFGYIDGNDKWNIGLICKIDISLESNTKKISYIPIVASPHGEQLADSKLAEEVISTFEKESEIITNSDFIQSNWKKFCLQQADSYIPMQFGWNNNFIRANRLLKGKLVRIATRPKARRNALNLIRCDSHREVINTLLSDEYMRTYIKEKEKSKNEL